MKNRSLIHGATLLLAILRCNGMTDFTQKNDYIVKRPRTPNRRKGKIRNNNRSLISNSNDRQAGVWNTIKSMESYKSSSRIFSSRLVFSNNDNPQCRGYSRNSDEDSLYLATMDERHSLHFTTLCCQFIGVERQDTNLKWTHPLLSLQ